MDRKGQDHAFIWNSHGDWVATLKDGFLWDPAGLWIGWAEGTDIYKRDGEWLGNLSKDNRILRKRTESRRELREVVSRPKGKPSLPGRAPLPPMFAELSYSVIDVVEEDPDIFKKISDLRKDMQ